MSNTINKQQFQTQMAVWYCQNGRDLPWRHTKNPYWIWISEIMLQQTQVDTVRHYYEQFIKTLPTIQSLAEADEDLAFKLWEGLGYYRRIRHMQEAAREIMEKYNGIFPDHYEDILKLKGIGTYTASAISSIAFGQNHGVIDGNTLRILSRVYNRQDNIALARTKKEFQILMDTLIEGSNPSEFNQSMMDLGAMICTPKNPKCSDCPICCFCKAHADGTEKLLPVNIKNHSKTDLYYITAILKKDDRYFLVKNTDHLLESLYSFVQFEVESPISFEETFYDTYHFPVRLLEYCKEIKHVFSHRIWHMNVYIGEIEADDRDAADLNSHLYTESEIEELPISTAHRKVYALRNLL